MEITALKNQIVNLNWELLREEFLNDHYKNIRNLEVEPGSLMITMNVYLNNAAEYITQLRSLLLAENINAASAYEILYKIKGGASCIGAERIIRACRGMENCHFLEADERIALCLLEHIRNEYLLLKSKLETLFEMERRIIDACGEVEKWW